MVHKEEIILSPGEERLIVISFQRPNVTYSVRVTDESGSPLEDAEVYIHQTSYETSAQTDENGNAVMLIAPDKVDSLQVWLSGYQTVSYNNIEINQLPTVCILKKEATAPYVR